MVITGYVPIEGHPRGADEYGRLGEQLGAAISPVAPLKAFYTLLPRCWYWKAIWEAGGTITHAQYNNPEKNTIAYHAVNHQKTEFIAEASRVYSDVDVFAWIDYGIFTVPGVTTEVLQNFVQRIEDPKSVVIPGCWPDIPNTINDEEPCWRFCGGALVVPRPLAVDFHEKFKDATLRTFWRTKHVTFEVNDLARLEKHGHVPMLWYHGDHNETMFDNYRDNPNEGKSS